MYPCLSSKIKAAESRHLVPVLASIFDDVRDRRCDEDNHISGMLQALAKAYDAIDTLEQKLPEQNLVDFQDGVESCLQHY